MQRFLEEQPGVNEAAAIMASRANLEILAAGRLAIEVDSRDEDLLLVARAEDESTASRAFEKVDDWLRQRGEKNAGEHRPRTLATALQMLPTAQWVSISVPGRYATRVAEEALDLGRNVFLYSDNVPLDEERRLKETARAKGLLLLGPDCGTAIVNGVGLGFANRVRRGSIGLVAASGTGLQSVTTRIHALGRGISHGLGTGGRDLRAEIGAATSHQALDLLARDPATRVIVLLSKPTSPATAVALLARARCTGKPVVVYLQDGSPPCRRLGPLFFATDLDDAAELATELDTTDLGIVGPPRAGTSGFVRGLFSGGTLALELLQVLRTLVQPVYSNLSAQGVEPVSGHGAPGHSVIDLGSDELTLGLPHPMIDPQSRLDRLRREADDPKVGVVVLDVVLGDGSDADPAASLAPTIAAIRADRDLPILCLVVGTDLDPQNTDAQVQRLSDAGATVHLRLADLADDLEGRLRASDLEATETDLGALAAPAVVNVGLEAFYDSLREQEAEVVHVDWRPPAGGNEQLMSILEKLRS